MDNPAPIVVTLSVTQKTGALYLNLNISSNIQQNLTNLVLKERQMII